MDDPRRYYVRRGDEQLGPLSLGEVRERWLMGELETNAPAWHAGLTDWTTLRNVLRPGRPVVASVRTMSRRYSAWVGWVWPTLVGAIFQFLVIMLCVLGWEHIQDRIAGGSPGQSEKRESAGREDRTPEPGMQRFEVGKLSGWAPGVIEDSGDLPPGSVEAETFISRRVLAQGFEMKVMISDTKAGFSAWSADDFVIRMLDGMGASGMPYVLETTSIAGYEVKRATVSLWDREQNKPIVVDMIIRATDRHSDVVILKTVAESPQAQEWAERVVERLWFH